MAAGWLSFIKSWIHTYINICCWCCQLELWSWPLALYRSNTDAVSLQSHCHHLKKQKNSIQPALSIILCHPVTFDPWPLFFLCLIGYQDGGFRQHLQRTQYVHGGADWSLRDHFPYDRTFVGHPWWTGTGHEHPWWDCHRLCHSGVLHQRCKLLCVCVCLWMDTLTNTVILKERRKAWMGHLRLVTVSVAAEIPNNMKSTSIQYSSCT